ncbi:MAG: DUF3450 family protein [Kiritimatiellia bacterium]
MHRFFSLLMILILSAGPLRASDPAESLASLEGLVDTWTRLRTEIAAEKREWEKQQEFLLAERGLLRDEVARLTEEIERFREFSTGEEQEREEALQQVESLSETLEGLEPVLTRLETRLGRQSALLPTSMRADFASLLSGFSKPGSDRNSPRVVDRMQAVASALVYLEELHPRLHVTREVLEDGSGSRREMDVLYIGLARAFAVSGSNDWAGVGIPTEMGWSWSARPELASTIRTAIGISRQQQSADFLTLPFSLRDTGAAE